MIRFFATLVYVTLGGVLSLSAQTLIDLQTQSKAVNFQGASSTAPLKTGAALPSTCRVGEMFFLTTAATGANVYGCPTTNTWVAQQGTGSGAPTVQNAGAVVGARTILNLFDGPGLVLATSDTGTSITIQTTLDTAVAATRASEQSGTSLSCVSSGGSSTAYTCSMLPTLTQYTTGMVLHWTPDVSSAGGSVTLNVDSLGAKAVTLGDGTTNPGPLDLIAGRMTGIWYDGTSFRMLNPSTPAGILGETQPTCSGAARGRLWFVAGNTGVKDGLTVCAKDASNAFAWRNLY